MKVMAATFVAILLVGCGSEGTKYNIPPGAFNDVSSEQLTELANLGIPINEGLHPPTIEGTYSAATLFRISGNVPNDKVTTFDPMSLKFSGQTSDNTVMVSYMQPKESGDGLGAFVSGNGQDFTIYTKIDGMVNGLHFRTAVLYSGSVDAAGIHFFEMALLFTQKDLDPNHILLEVDQARVIGERDQLAARTTSYP